MNSSPPHVRLIRYLTAAGTVGGGLAHGAVVYQSFETTLTDPDATTTNLGQTLAAIRFDGTSVTLTNSSTGGALALSADDNYELQGSKTVDGGRQAVSPYQQTATILGLGEAITAGFTTAGAGTIVFSGDATDQLIGVSTPEGRLGWVRFSYTGSGTTLTVHDAAFQSDVGEPIAAGLLVVPEPSALGLAGLAGGLVALRRRRQAAA